MNIKFILASLLFFFSFSALAADIQLTEKNTVVLRGEVDEVSTSKLAADILASSASELYLFIDSPGGAIFPGMKLLEVLQNTDKKVKCIAFDALSMAFVLFQACEERYVMSSSVLMQHVASYSLRGEQPNNVSFSTFLTSVTDTMDEMQADRLGMSVEAFKKKVRDDWWLFGANAVKAGVADKLVTVTCSSDYASKYREETITLMFWTFKVKWSECPLISGPVSVQAGRTFNAPGMEKEAMREYEDIMSSLNVRNYVESIINK